MKRPLLILLEADAMFADPTTESPRGRAWHDMDSIRTIQELAGWYQLPFLSLS
jgi:hypothetical protein